MRLFVAIELSGPVKDALIDVRNALSDLGVRGHFTSEENLHLTLAFIGEQSDPQPALTALSTLRFSPFVLAPEGLGCFGDLWWAGIRPSDALGGIVRRIRRALADGGIPFDRKRFHPHITLVRKAVGPMPGIPIREAEMTVDSIALMRSDRGRNGMIYTCLGTVDADD